MIPERKKVPSLLDRPGYAVRIYDAAATGVQLATGYHPVGRASVRLRWKDETGAIWDAPAPACSFCAGNEGAGGVMRQGPTPGFALILRGREYMWLTPSVLWVGKRGASITRVEIQARVTPEEYSQWESSKQS